MTPQQATLKPCPFCGMIDPHKPDCYFELKPAEAPYTLEIAAWNRRAPAHTEPAVDRDAVLREAVAACKAEEVEETGTDGDKAYNLAITHCIGAIRALALATPASPAVPSYTPGKWFDVRTLDEMQAFYRSRLPAIREAAKEHGYAIGLHGSERRDFDLMAMQWRVDAADKDTLARAIAMAACGITRNSAYDWEAKPSGRFAVSLPICWLDHDNPDFDKPSMGHIDLSVLAPQPATATMHRLICQLASLKSSTPEAVNLLVEEAKRVIGKN